MCQLKVLQYKYNNRLIYLFTFFPLPSPNVSKFSPTQHLVTNVLMWGGPFSLITSNKTVKFLFKASSWTSEIGDFSSEDESASIITASESGPENHGVLKI